MSVNDFLMDFAIASLFIMIGQLIRAKVKLVQKFFVPASMIAGFLALALGSQGLNVLPFSEGISSYAGSLIIVIFAGVGISGFSFSKKNFKTVLPSLSETLFLAIRLYCAIGSRMVSGISAPKVLSTIELTQPFRSSRI